jgi:dTDP-4-dehydrorhamnose reductase
LKQDFYTQRDQPRPISVYGRAKLDGERLAQVENARTIVVRTGYIFGLGGTNFLSTVLTRASRGDTLKVISDTFGTPTYGRDLAVRLRELAIIDLPGIYHVVNSGEGASFEMFTREALRMANQTTVVVESVLTDSLQRPAPRPRYSKLKCLLSPAIGLPPLRTWQEGLAAFVRETHK